MRLLVLGGTRFVGRHLVATALAAGHEVTLFHRGRTHPELFPQAEKLHGDRDRDGDLSRIAGRRWDAVVDCCGYRPRQVRATARLLTGAVEQYVFISTVSVYADLVTGPSEASALRTPPAGADRDAEGGDADYGALKVLCEQAAEEALPGRVLQVRPGLLVGPHDPTRRFSYWVHRLAAGGEVLAPGRPAGPVQLLDARDLAAWLLVAVERHSIGPYNVTAPRGSLSFGELLETCRTVAGSDARVTWVDEEFLTSRDIEPWEDLPLWVPKESSGFHDVDTSRAIASGLRPRPLAETVRDVLAEPGLGLGEDAASPPRLGREREAELLRAWHERGRSPHA
ncbi:MAG TPA: SDR family oxidoreductase [Thermoanaerobaculia bacterium]